MRILAFITLLSSFQTAEALKCYSCMSSEYKFSWRHIEGHYEHPISFTDSCTVRDYDDVYALREKECSDMCIWIRSPYYDGAKLSGYKYIRGCLSDLKEYNKSAVNALDNRISCTYLYHQELFRKGSEGYKYFERAGNRPVNICSCHSSSCNAMVEYFSHDIHHNNKKTTASTSSTSESTTSKTTPETVSSGDNNVKKARQLSPLESVSSSPINYSPIFVLFLPFYIYCSIY